MIMITVNLSDNKNKYMNNKNNNSTTNVCDNKNHNNRDY